MIQRFLIVPNVLVGTLRLIKLEFGHGWLYISSMKPVAIFTHTECEPPGYLVNLLRAIDYPFRLVCLHQGTNADFELENFSKLIFMGGPGNVAEPEPWMLQEMDIIRQARKAGIAALGICLGAQLMSAALGGKIWQADSLEVGWHTVQLLDTAKSSAWFHGLDEQITVFQWHAHNFSAPQGTLEIATSECTPCQAFVDGKNLAIQFHLEMTVEIIQTLIEKYASDLEPASSCVQSSAQILQDIEQRCEQTFRVADILLKNWLEQPD
jgi:GMP synthase-like glutamine amidotransferase